MKSQPIVITIFTAVLLLATWLPAPVAAQERDDAAGEAARREEEHRRASEAERERRDARPPWVEEALRRKAKRDRERASRGETGSADRPREERSREELLKSMSRDEANALLRAEELERQKRLEAMRAAAEEQRLARLRERAAARGMTPEELQALQDEERGMQSWRAARSRDERLSPAELEQLKHLRRLAQLDRLAAILGVDGDAVLAIEGPAALAERIVALRARELERHQQVVAELEAQRPQAQPDVKVAKAGATEVDGDDRQDR